MCHVEPNRHRAPDQRCRRGFLLFDQCFSVWPRQQYGGDDFHGGSGVDGVVSTVVIASIAAACISADSVAAVCIVAAFMSAASTGLPTTVLQVAVLLVTASARGQARRCRRRTWLDGSRPVRWSRPFPSPRPFALDLFADARFHGLHDFNRSGFSRDAFGNGRHWNRRVAASGGGLERWGERLGRLGRAGIFAVPLWRRLLLRALAL